MAEWGSGGTEHERFLALQEQARVSLQRRPRVTLEDQATYYREQAEDTTLPIRDRQTWKQLADEMDTRLGRNAPPSKQEELFQI